MFSEFMKQLPDVALPWTILYSAYHNMLQALPSTVLLYRMKRVLDAYFKH